MMGITNDSVDIINNQTKVISTAKPTMTDRLSLSLTSPTTKTQCNRLCDCGTVPVNTMNR